MSATPNGWAEAKLSDIAIVIRGITFPASAKENTKTATNVCCLRTSNVQKRVEWDNIYYVNQTYIKKPTQLVQDGDILISMANSYELVGKVALVESPPQAAAFGAFIAAVRPTAIANSRYLFHTLRSSRVQAALRAGSSQTTNIANISVGTLNEVPVELPPLAEQQRIADKLNTVLARVDACRDRLARVAPLLKRFRQSVLAAATSGRLTEEWRSTNSNSNAGLPLSIPRFQRSAASSNNERWLVDLPNNWAVVRAENIVVPGDDIVYGIVQPGPKLELGVPYVQVSDIVAGQLKPDCLSRTSLEIAKQYQRSAIRSGDVLLGIIRATKVVVVPDGLEGANISRSVARLRPDRFMLPRFLAIVLESPPVQEWLRAQHRGMDMPVLNLSQVRLAPITVAPLDEQTEIVRRVESLFVFADRLEARLTQARSAAERLTPALLAKAFRGELVPQDPEDESAAELLKRLAGQRQAVSVGRVRGRKFREDSV